MATKAGTSGASAPEIPRKRVLSVVTVRNVNISKRTPGNSLSVQVTSSGVGRKPIAAAGRELPSSSASKPMAAAGRELPGAFASTSGVTTRLKQRRLDTEAAAAVAPGPSDQRKKQSAPTMQVTQDKSAMKKACNKRGLQNVNAGDLRTSQRKLTESSRLATIDENNIPVNLSVEMEDAQGMRMDDAEEIDPNALIILDVRGNCVYCGEDLKEQQGIMLHSCNHIFCRHCLSSSVELQDSVEIMCPVGCGGRLLEKEIKALCTKEVFRKFEERGMAAARAALGGCAVECTWPGCKGWAEVDSIEARRFFVCPFCGKQTCLTCKAVHEGVTCAEYDELKAKAAATGENVHSLMEKMEARAWGFSQLQGQLERSKQRQSLGTFLNKDLFFTAVEIECSICFGDIAAGEGIILHECFHTFCKECIIDLVRHSETPEVKCPYIDANFTCNCYLSPREIKALAPKDIYDGWLEKSVKLAEGAIVNSCHCKTVDCPGWVEIEDVENAIGTFTCSVCNKTNCLQCKAIHEGISCQDYKNRLVQSDNDKKSEDALNEMVTKGECMRCPKCKSVVTKLTGCDWLVCLCCRTELCWATKGPRWGPKGKGDDTGGCKCELYRNPAGRRCTPKCQNCH